jgi:CheY-like chemotaxis protein
MRSAKAHTILLVEDQENDVFFLERAFKQAQIGNPLFRVRDGEEAIAYLSGTGAYADRVKSPWPDLMLLDLKMPRKDGFEVITWVRDQPGPLRRLPIVVLTSSKEDPDVNRAYELGANTYLMKPVKFDGLVEMMKTLKLYWLILAEKPDCSS